MKDKMNVSDIARPDVYGKPRQFEGRDYLNAHDIEGSSPSKLKQSRAPKAVDNQFNTKDIQGDKWKSKRVVNPMDPEYMVPTASRRIVTLGSIERNKPKELIVPTTKRKTHFTDDIEASKPKHYSAISDN